MTDHTLLAPLQALSGALVGLTAAAAPAVVSVHSHQSRSSGFVWRPGFIVTADEALADEGDVAVELSGGNTVAARVAGRDPTTDIALLRIDRTDLAPAALNRVELAAGAVAVVVGAENGEPTTALGVVSRAGGPWRSMRGGEIDARLELAISLQQRAEGGLALDAAGRAFGMAVFGPRGRVLVIPTVTIERVAVKLESHGRIARGYLGLGLQPVAVESGEGSGAMVMSVDPKGPGAVAGVHQGDVIVAWNGEPIRHLQSVLRSLGSDSVGRTITLGLRRAGEVRQVPLTIGERPAA
jgi:S1-C subfamily serine protease